MTGSPKDAVCGILTWNAGCTKESFGFLDTKCKTGFKILPKWTEKLG